MEDFVRAFASLLLNNCEARFPLAVLPCAVEEPLKPLPDTCIQYGCKNILSTHFFRISQLHFEIS